MNNNIIDFRAGYYEWNVIINDEIAFTFLSAFIDSIIVDSMNENDSSIDQEIECTVDFNINYMLMVRDDKEEALCEYNKNLLDLLTEDDIKVLRNIMIKTLNNYYN